MKVCSVVLDGELEVHAGRWSLAFGLGSLYFVLCTLCFVLCALYFVLCAWCNFLLLPAACLLLLPASYFLLPGLIACSPRLHSSHNEGSTEGTESVARAVRDTPTSAAPEERSIIDAAPTTVAPAR